MERRLNPPSGFVDSLADAADYYASLKWDTPLKYNVQPAWQVDCKLFPCDSCERSSLDVGHWKTGCLSNFILPPEKTVFGKRTNVFAKNCGKETSMPSYLILFSFTQRGLEKIKDLPARVKNAKETIRQLGGEIQGYYGILGSEYDTLLIITAPNDEKVAQMAVGISLLGNVRTQTHRLFNEQELFKIVSSLP